MEQIARSMEQRAKVEMKGATNIKKVEKRERKKTFQEIPLFAEFNMSDRKELWVDAGNERTDGMFQKGEQ